MVLVQGGGGDIPQDRSWSRVKTMLARPHQFLASLKNFQKENIPTKVLAALEPYLEDKEFDPDFVKSKSAAAASFCSWVINIVKYHELSCELADKRRTLSDASAV